MALKYFVGFVTSYINIFGASSFFGLGYCKLALGYIHAKWMEYL